MNPTTATRQHKPLVTEMATRIIESIADDHGADPEALSVLPLHAPNNDGNDSLLDLQLKHGKLPATLFAATAEVRAHD